MANSVGPDETAHYVIMVIFLPYLTRETTYMCAALGINTWKALSLKGENKLLREANLPLQKGGKNNFDRVAYHSA